MNKQTTAFFLLSNVLVLTSILFDVQSLTAQNTKLPPDDPALVQPFDQSFGNPTGVTLSVIVTDPEQDEMTVTFYGRKKKDEQEDFTIVGLPDTQYYTSQQYNGTPEIFYSQTQWIVDNRESENIVFVSHLGDCVENGDEVETEWQYADTAMTKIEDPVTTMLMEGVPYAINVGNHDQTPGGNANSFTELYNAYFGETRFLGRQYYGGHYGDNNDNSYQLFEAGGMKFIVINLEFDPVANADVLTWADSLLNANTNCRAIIVSHFLIGPGNPGSFGPQGQAIYNQFKDNSNVFLMLGAHWPGEGQRTDIHNGDTIHTLLADYQNRDFGGNGWLRLFKFSPANNTIEVKTYSPWLGEWEQDADSEFTLNYNMEMEGFEIIGTAFNIASGTTASFDWPNLDPNTEYEWFVEIDDGTETVTGPRWFFTTGHHQLEINVFLEGPFDEMIMNTSLTLSMDYTLIPLQQPYNAPPWNYDGLESVTQIPPDVVDWILIELRDTTLATYAQPSTIINRQAAFLQKDGTVINPDGSTSLSFNNSVIHGLFLVIKHRNHLAIMSADPLVNTAGTFTFDFTTMAENTFGGNNSIKSLPNNFWGLVAGDGNADGIIDEADKTSWNPQSGYAGYLLNDLNLDRQSNNQDKNDFWENNLGRFSHLPE